ncbi:ricin-type beta-trefoil lectin domain protein [Silvanigrella aquatica]|uniref:Ricin B lectin domain-containing protein n=1 Tax=Silvanigrella aquatica TaxID=1915309 RepID=A0A1L4CYQ9_9BACT|nr:ricin-type beta-trefoil lectin domain protein [Silvanigrella aquatica]APJ03086.1 hypothetical protein AXG55_03845 [Silvanigrella aquatica]
MQYKNVFNFLKLIHILFFIAVNPIYIYGMDNEGINLRSVPKVVYRATPSKPDKVFKNGFSRSREGHTNLALHIGSETGDLSTAMISTTSNFEYANYYAAMYAQTYWQVDYYYIYEIIPQNNFIDVTATYERTLSETQHLGRRAGLESLRRQFTHEYEYVALYMIRPETILAATRYELNFDTGEYEHRETIFNENAQTNIMPEIHPNNYPLGTVDGVEYPFVNKDCLFNPNNTGTPFVIHRGSPLFTPPPLPPRRYKREGLQTHQECFIKPFQNKKNPEFTDIKSIKIEVKNSAGKKYCLTVYPYNNVLLAECSQAQNWYITQFGQIITQVNDIYKDQYYCLTELNSIDNYDYVKVQICDLTKSKQLWKVEFTEQGQSIIKSNSNKILHAHDDKYKITYLRDKENKDKLSLVNADVLKANLSEPFIQFSIPHLLTEEGETIYPAASGNVYVEKPALLNGYKNYYNAHNNALFSTNGNENEYPSLCYISSLIQSGGGAWGWVKSNYCSLKSAVSDDFKWILHRSLNDSSYEISDIGANVLRVNKNFSPNQNFVYTADNHGFYDNSYFNQSFTFNIPAMIFADRMSSLDRSYARNLNKLTRSFNAVRNYYYNLIYQQ